MGNRLCYDENRETNNISNEETIEENNTVYSNNKKRNNNNLDSHNKSNELFLEEINNLKSSIFDNENENDEIVNENENEINDNDKFNSEEEHDNHNININNNNFQQSTEKKKYISDINKSGSNTEKMILKNKINKKKKKNENENLIEIKKVIDSNLNYKNSPLIINNNFNIDKEIENDFYLINTSQYIGLKSSNSNLVFLKNNKEAIFNKYEFIPLVKNLNKNTDNNNVRRTYNYNYNNNFSNSLKTTSMNPNIVVTSRSHNIPFGEKLTDKNNSISSNKNIIRNKKLIDCVNKNIIYEKLHNDNKRIIEIYIYNQIKKIINLLKSNKGKLKRGSYSYNNKFISNNSDNINIHYINNMSFDILNTCMCQTIINKGKNFCIKYFDNGSIYIGEIKNNICNGHGKYLNTKGDIIMSFFEDNYLQGYGIIEAKRYNSIFEGEFEKNKFDGYGIELFDEGSAYYGQYKNNEKSGIGTYDWGEGNQYQGEWKNGLPNGYGIFSDNKNRIYEGEWKYGKMNGIGLFKWEDGRKYIGMFNNDKREGFGIFFWSKPLKIYLGFWVNGLQNGIGKIYTSFKEKYYLWEEGKIIKKLSEKKILESKLDMLSNKLIKKYFYFFKMTLDDLLTLMLDL